MPPPPTQNFNLLMFFVFSFREKKLIDHDRDMIKLRSDLDNQTNALRYIYILIRNIPETEEDKLHDHVKTVISHVAPSVNKWFNPIRLGPKSSKEIDL